MSPFNTIQPIMSKAWHIVRKMKFKQVVVCCVCKNILDEFNGEYCVIKVKVNIALTKFNY